MVILYIVYVLTYIIHLYTFKSYTVLYYVDNMIYIKSYVAVYI